MSDNNNRELQNTEYLSVTFEEIKQKLIERAESHYPKTYKDFSKTSFGSLMFDLVAMVGEQLNFYAQFVANEGFAEYARTGIGLQSAARQNGVSLQNSAPQGMVRVSFPLVVSEDQVSVEESCIYTFQKGALLTGEGNQIVMTQQTVRIDPKVDLMDAARAQPITTEFSPDGSRPLIYYVQKDIPAIAGELKRFVIDIGSNSGFLSIEVPDRTCTDIISILDSEGNEYYEVDNLSINTVETGINFVEADTLQQVEKMIDMPVPRRFQVVERGAAKFIEFGHGSEDTLKKKRLPASSSDLHLNKQGHAHVSSREVSFERYLTNDKYGVAPTNTTLTVLYRSNDSDNSNISAGEITTIQSAEIIFEDEQALGVNNMQFIKNNISCNNQEPFNGVVRFQSTKEIALTCMAAAGAQSRAVTEKDIVSMCYVIPPQFGKVTKASVSRDSRGLRKMLNLYCISEDSNKNLQKASNLLKQNLKSWLGSVKMVTDRIDIFDAHVLNLGLYLDITLKDQSEVNSAMPRIREYLYDEITLTTPEIGQAFSIGEIERILGTMPLVQRVNKVQVSVKNGQGYSNTRFDIMPNTAPDGSAIYLPEDFIWEVKNPTDIIGILK